MDFQSLTNQTKWVHIGGGLITWRGTLLVHLGLHEGTGLGPKGWRTPLLKKVLIRPEGPFRWSNN